MRNALYAPSQIAKDKANKQSKADKEKKKALEFDPTDGGDEKISEKEFVKSFSKAMKLPVGDAKRLFKAADRSRDGFLDFHEFLCMMALMQPNSTSEQKLELVFAMYDVDHSGALDQIEVRKLLENMLTTEDADHKEAQIKKVVGRFDADGDRKVSLPELKVALKDEGFLNEFFGQNVQFDEAATKIYEAKVKSFMCLVM